MHHIIVGEIIIKNHPFFKDIIHKQFWCDAVITRGLDILVKTSNNFIEGKLYFFLSRHKERE